MTAEYILEQIGDLTDHHSHPLRECASIENIIEKQGIIHFQVLLSEVSPENKAQLRSSIEDHFSKLGIDVFVSIKNKEHTAQNTHTAQKKMQGMFTEGTFDRFKKIIAVYSAKGGVGKSTISVELARRLALQGFKTAIVDLDIYGPSIPRILGIRQKVSVLGEKFLPASKNGIHMMSIGLLVPELDSPLIWRAPMANGVMKQIFEDTNWDNEYDILILDMPPGTGDIPIAVGQSIPIDGVLAVTTPQGVALEDTVKGIHMFQKFHACLLGIVKNMGFVSCPKCDDKIFIFPKNEEFDQYLKEQSIEVLAELPIDVEISKLADKGCLENMPKDSYWDKEFVKIVDRISKIVAS